MALVRIGSRGSRLALTQAELAADALRTAAGDSGLELALVPITTAGDRDRTKPFGELGGRGVFVKELEEALLAGRIDVAVHSAKDMTAKDPDGLAVGAYLAREDARDALCGAAELRGGMRVGTASARRRAQLLALEPELVIEPLRGNIETRLRKRGERGLDAVVLAACGLDRLGLGAEVGHRFEPEELLPEAGQGALALQVRAGEESRVGRGRRWGDAPPCRGGAQLRRGRRGRLPRAGRCAPRRAHADRARRGRGRRLDRAADRRRRPRARAPARGARIVTSSARSRDGHMRVVVTRPRAQAGPLVERLEALGLAVVECPLIEIEPLEEPSAIDTSGYDWVVVTSPNGADLFARRRSGDHARIAAVGPGTAETLRTFGIEPDLVPSVSTQEGLVEQFPRPTGRVLFVGAEGSRRVLADALDADFVPLYRTRLLRPSAPDGDLVVLASSSAARSFAALGAPLPAVTIGPQTTRAARGAGLEVVAEARTHDLDGLVDAVAEACSSRS